MTVAGTVSPLRAESRVLRPYVDRIRSVADDVGVVPTADLRASVSFVYDFLVTELIPYTLATDEVLYPTVDRLMGVARATVPIQKDHAEVLRLAVQLNGLRRALVGSDLSPTVAMALRRVLYGLYYLTRSLFAKEDEIYIPFLEERLTMRESELLAEDLGRAAARINAEA